LQKGYPNIERAARLVIQDAIEGKIKFESAIEDE
jgi:hypothetical protein